MSLPTIAGAAAGLAPSTTALSPPSMSTGAPGQGGFAEALSSVRSAQLENSPRTVSPSAASGPRVESKPASEQVLERVERAQAQLESVLKLAQSGTSFSPAQLLALQVRVYQASQEVDLAGKVVEKVTGGVKQVLQTQV